MERLLRQMGRPVRIGRRDYRIKGYFSNIVAPESDDEPEVAAAIARLLKRPGTFVDVGANLGQTLGKVLAVDPDRSYLGFEPQIGACHYIHAFLTANGLRNARVLPFGLSDKTGLMSFWSAGEADTMASLVDEGQGKTQSVVMTRIGDEVLSELDIGDIAAIKIDVEGAEYQVLRGFERTLSTIGPPIIFEVLANVDADGFTDLPAEHVKANSERANTLHTYLTSLGYRIHVLGMSGEDREIQVFDLDDPAKIFGTNFVATKG
ncbi:MAG: FkbM family methyltransferase [Pseudomonadota bacterium]